ncbi:hypothetical protein RclHR1_03350007 [Rhizophagus clarus]|uniref:Uncharacterized protein n=1 Tax=Rhizophagus clarus TaxID=94130 RepID=A0A2Z6S3J8_9GLOM|nr:hypothetical protein RclHR1_03350007 [Rhizophagus clarus]GES97178.1 hypothetical protein RCL_jg7056.t1 [Rhizophagus clarus]
MSGSEQENITEKVEKKINRKDNRQESSESIGGAIKKTAMKHYGFFKIFITMVGVFSMVYYAITIKSDIEITNGELRIDLVDKKFEFKFDALHDKMMFFEKKVEFEFDVLRNKIDKLDKRFDTFENKINVLMVNKISVGLR